MRNIATLLLTLALGFAGCPANPGPDDDPTDTGQCPPGIDQQTFIDTVLPSLCAWFLTCPDNRHETVEDCVRVFRSHYVSQPGWHECNAAACATWLADPPTCTDGAVDTPAACNRVKDRDD